MQQSDAEQTSKHIRLITGAVTYKTKLKDTWKNESRFVEGHKDPIICFHCKIMRPLCSVCEGKG